MTTREARHFIHTGETWAPADLHMRILSTVRRIPPGYVSTYGLVAKAAGLPRRARMVGSVLRHSYLARDTPWHRVINASGRVSERSGAGAARQRRRLEAEGVTFDAAGRIDLAVHLWLFEDNNAD